MNTGKRKELKARYRSLSEMVGTAIRKADPIGLIGMGAPPDEYDPELGTILPRIKSALSEDELCLIIHEEFVRWFGEPIAGPVSAYKNIAKEIWQKYNAA